MHSVTDRRRWFWILWTLCLLGHVGVGMAQGARDLRLASVRSILANAHSQNRDDMLVIMEVPGFPGKPVELAWLASIARSPRGNSLSVAYWSIPATSKGHEALEPFLEKGLATGFSGFPKARFKVSKHSGCVLALMEDPAAHFDKLGAKQLDGLSYVVGIRRAGKVSIYGEDRAFDSRAFQTLLEELDRWLVPHRKRLLKRTLHSVFGQ